MCFFFPLLPREDDSDVGDDSASFGGFCQEEEG